VVVAGVQREVGRSGARERERATVTSRREERARSAVGVRANGRRPNIAASRIRPDGGYSPSSGGVKPEWQQLGSKANGRGKATR